MEYDKNICPVVDVDGVIASGKQFDIDITLPKDNRNVIYGIIRDHHKEPVKDAVVKLIEVIRDCGKEERRPVSHTFTDKEGEFVFGPLCPDKYYEIQIWADRVKHSKICATSEHKGSCLKGIDIDCKRPAKPCKQYDEELVYEESRTIQSEEMEKSTEELSNCCDEKKNNITNDSKSYPVKPFGFRR